jgi:hypothetical protein
MGNGGELSNLENLPTKTVNREYILNVGTHTSHHFWPFNPVLYPPQVIPYGMHGMEGGIHGMSDGVHGMSDGIHGISRWNPYYFQDGVHMESM